MIIQNDFFKISELESKLKAFSIAVKFPQNTNNYHVSGYINNYLRDDLFVFAEYPYVDKVYRDSYYSYFASKNKLFGRDCIRLALFDKEITLAHFRDEKLSVELQKSFVGYLILRPIEFSPGRTMLSPKAIKNKNFRCCLVETDVVINGVRLEINAFPHSWQDSETISCAETTIWSVMEYFGNKYSNYSPTLPSKIMSVLSAFSYERQLPSHGLAAAQISFALKKFGFGVRTYSRGAHGDEEFEIILNTYVESGIPVILILENYTTLKGHATVCIGREELDSDVYSKKALIQKHGNIDLIDFAKINDMHYVTIDDNVPPYQLFTLSNPNLYRLGVNPDYKITAIIMPLYSKIYLEANLAKKVFLDILLDPDLKLNIPQELVVRFFLTSSRSLKSKMALDSSLSPSTKEIFMVAAMPKFVWVGEISDPTLAQKGQVKGLIVIDATEPLAHPLLFAITPDMIVTKDMNDEFEFIDLKTDSFNIYNNNLKNHWT